MLPEVQLHKALHAPPPSPAVLLFPPIPTSLDVSPFCSPPSNPKLLPSPPARQGPRKLPGFKRSTCPERMGSLRRRGAWAAQGGRKSGPCAPARLSPSGRIAKRKANKRAQERAGQRDPPKSGRHIPTPLPSFIPSKEGRKICVFCCLPHPRGRERRGKKGDSCVMALETS